MGKGNNITVGKGNLTMRKGNCVKVYHLCSYFYTLLYLAVFMQENNLWCFYLLECGDGCAKCVLMANANAEIVPSCTLPKAYYTLFEDVITTAVGKSLLLLYLCCFHYVHFIMIICEYMYLTKALNNILSFSLSR